MSRREPRRQDQRSYQRRDERERQSRIYEIKPKVEVVAIPREKTLGEKVWDGVVVLSGLIVLFKLLLDWFS